MSVIAVSTSKALISAGWDDVPHLSQARKAKMLQETPPHLRDARSKGIPALGVGAIYAIAESEFVIPPFLVPRHYPRGYGLDVGWNKTAAAFTALDRDNDILFVTSEHYQGRKEPSAHAAAIKARGDWLPGTIDPAARGRSQDDGTQLLETYRLLGLRLVEADNALEAGILDVYERLATGRLKVFATCTNWLSEYRIYRRDEHGHVVKKFNHLMDATRYAVRPGFVRSMIVKPIPKALPGARFKPGDKRAGY